MKCRYFKIQILLILISGSNLSLWSQQIEVSASNADFNFTSTNFHKILGHDRDHFYVIKFHNNQFYFERLDKNLNLLEEKPIRLYEGLKSFGLEYACYFYNDIYVFFSRKRFNNVTLYYQKINKRNLTPSSDLKEITTIRYINGNNPDFRFAISRHETRILVVCQVRPLLAKVQYNEYYVLDQDFNLIWKKKDSFEFTGQGPRENKFVVDDIGNFSMLSLQKRETLLSLFSDVKNLYNVYRYTDNGKNFKVYPVSIKSKYIRGIRIIGGDHGELYCAGLYSELYRPGVRGSFFFEIDPERGNASDTYINEFDDALLIRLRMLKEPVIEREELVNYIMSDLVLRENGKIILIAEQFLEQSYNTYNNLLVMCYNASGNIDWTQIVRKNQDFNFKTVREVDPSDYRDYIMESGSFDPYIDNYCSYALMAPITGNSIIVFYNDNIRNLDNPGRIKNLTRPRKSYIIAVTIDEYGNMSKKPVLTWKKKALFPEPLRFYDTRFNTIVIPAFKGNRYNYYKITADF